jgi:ABC-2 type transport system ATP-binding protein
MPIIQISGLHKHFGKVQALDGLNMSVEAGEVHGFLGPNGAGKTTTMRCLLGILRADSGTVRLFGQDAWRNSVELHKRLAYVPGEANLWPNLTGGEVIDLFGALRGRIPDNATRQQWLDRFELDPAKKCGDYSKGNRQKVALVAAFCSDAELFILDEPTSGLDPLMEKVFQDVIGELKAQGRTVLLSSHILSEVDKLADTVSVIRDGKVVADGPIAQLKAGTSLEDQFLSKFDEAR